MIFLIFPGFAPPGTGNVGVQILQPMKTFRFIVGCLGSLLACSCSFFHPSRDYLYRPTLLEVANPPPKKTESPATDGSDAAKTAVPAGADADGKPKTINVPTDADVLQFANMLKNVFRGQLNESIIARHVSAVSQVLTAAAAATLTTISSGAQNSITILAATSAVMPQLQGIFDAKGRAAAFDQGGELLSQAEAAYYTAIGALPDRTPAEKAAADKGGADGNAADALSEDVKTRINRRLTPQGAALYAAALAAIQVVEKLEVAQLPTIDQIRAAKGEFIAELGATRTQTMEISFPMADPTKAQTMQVNVSGLAEDNVSYSSAGDVVAAKTDKGALSLTALKPGDALVTVLLNQNGATQKFHVKTYVPLKLNPPGPLRIESAGPIEIAAVGQKLAAATSSDPTVVALAPAVDFTKGAIDSVKLTPLKAGQATIWLTGEQMDAEAVKVTVVAAPLKVKQTSPLVATDVPTVEIEGDGQKLARATSSDPGVVTVTSAADPAKDPLDKVVLTPRKVGTAKIELMGEHFGTATITVAVTAVPLKLKQSDPLEAKGVAPVTLEGDGQKITAATSSDASVVSVASADDLAKGPLDKVTVKPKKAGAATIQLKGDQLGTGKITINVVAVPLKLKQTSPLAAKVGTGFDIEGDGQLIATATVVDPAIAVLAPASDLTAAPLPKITLTPLKEGKTDIHLTGDQLGAATLSIVVTK